jgi:hypothetical protein
MTVMNAMAVSSTAKLYDMVTAVPEQTLTVLHAKKYNAKMVGVPATAVVIAGGNRPLPADRFYGNPAAPAAVDPKETAAHKAHRQSRFPVELLQAAFGIKVEEGQASVEADRRHILNSLTGMPLNSEPPLRHEQYDRINMLLHTHYALGGLPRCVDEDGEALEQCLAALRVSPPTDRFIVSAPLTSATVKQLSDLLPPTLQHLELPNADMYMVPESLSKFTSLHTLNLQYNKFYSLPESVGNLGALRTLNLSECYNLKALPESIGNLGALRTLDLYSCHKLAAVPESVGSLGALHTLDLSECRELTALPESIGNLGALHTLNLSGCGWKLTALPESVGSLGALHTLNLSKCYNLKALPESIGNLGALQSLGLSGCDKLKTLPASISQLTQLDEASHKRVEAILHSALIALPFAAAPALLCIRTVHAFGQSTMCR